MNNEQAQLIGQEIAKAAKLVAVPIQDERECRAICVKMAIETKTVAMSLRVDGTVQESADQVLTAAQMYYDFITYDSKADE